MPMSDGEVTRLDSRMPLRARNATPPVGAAAAARARRELATVRCIDWHV
jgi:hypothetical protein